MPDIPMNVLITLAIAIFGAIGGWFAVKGKVTQLGEQVSKLTLDMAGQDNVDVGLLEGMAELRLELKYLRRDLDAIRDEAARNREQLAIMAAEKQVRLESNS